jgi:hypothetical protein
MKLLRTIDGLLGVEFPNGKVVWCDDQAHVNRIVFAHFSRYNHITSADIAKDISAALNEMAKHNHDLAYFGVLGGFMYTCQDEAA